MNGNYESIIQEFGVERVKKSEPMARWITFKIGGPADLFYEAETTKEIARCVELCRKFEIPYFILGGGSNLLVSDKGIRGMVIKISNLKFQISNLKVSAGAGVPLGEVVEKAAQAGLTGLEFAVGIPGTLGGAIVGNAGAWQQSIGEKVVRILILDTAGQTKWIDRRECQFGYRESRFKATGEVVLETELELEAGAEETIRETMRVYLERRSTQPKDPSAGCVFVNPKPKVAGVMIEQCALKGKKYGGAEISTRHANFIVNSHQATCQDVLELIRLIKKKVKEKFSVDLVEEIKIIGEL